MIGLFQMQGCGQLSGKIFGQLKHLASIAAFDNDSSGVEDFVLEIGGGVIHVCASTRNKAGRAMRGQSRC